MEKTAKNNLATAVEPCDVSTEGLISGNKLCHTILG